GRSPEPQVKVEPRRIGLVIDPRNTRFPYVQIQLVAGPSDEENQHFVGPITPIPQNQYVNPSAFLEQDREILTVARKFQPSEILKHLKRNLPFGDFYDDYDQILNLDP